MNRQEVKKFIDETVKYINAPFLEYLGDGDFREPAAVTHLKSKLLKALVLLEKAIIPSSKVEA